MRRFQFLQNNPRAARTRPRQKLRFFVLVSFVLLLRAGALFAQGRPVSNVVVSPVVTEVIRDEILQLGTAESWRTSRVATEVAGRVEKLEVRRGAKVQKGDLLAKLSDSGLLLKLKESEARRNAAIARLDRAKDNRPRLEGLMKEQLVSERAFRDAKLTVQELEQTLVVDQAERLQIKDELDKKNVVAPFDGIVTQSLTEEGEWLQVGGGIVQLVDLSKVRILVQVPEKYIREIKAGVRVSVTIDAIPGETFSGAVHAMIPAGDREARLFPIEVHLENKGLRINDGMLARVAFGLGLEQNVLMIDKDAVIRKGATSFVFVVKEGKAMQQTIKTGRGKAGLIEVQSGLNEGDTIVIRGNERLMDGSVVNAVPEHLPAQREPGGPVPNILETPKNPVPAAQKPSENQK